MSPARRNHALTTKKLSLASVGDAWLGKNSLRLFGSQLIQSPTRNRASTSPLPRQEKRPVKAKYEYCAEFIAGRSYRDYARSVNTLLLAPEMTLPASK